MSISVLTHVENFINSLLQEISEEEIAQMTSDYCNMIDDEWLELVLLANPRFYGPDYDSIENYASVCGI
jgi:hypothetical protein